MTLLSGSPQPHDIGHAVEHLRSRWPWFAAFGAISLLLGVASLALVSAATVASVYLIAIFVIIIGGLDISLALHGHRWTSGLFVGSVGLLYIVAGFLATRLPEAPRWQVGVAGALTAVLGVLIVFGWPQNSPYLLGIFLGVDMMMYGAGQLGFALFLRRRFSPFV